MDEKEFALECMKVQQLDFVDQVNVLTNVPYVYVELSLTLSALLPKHLSVMQFERSEFTVKNVMVRFEVQIVERLIIASNLAQEQLRSAKSQARRRS
jgi:hypothetical protein